MVSIGDQLELKRSDLLNFPKDTVDLILEMQKDGWRGHRNSQGHVKMLAPDGKTHVMATSNKNSATYVKSGYNQYKKKHGEKKVNSSSQKVVQKWPCARPGCPKVYASEQQLSDHIMVDHEKKLLCPEKDCHEVRDTKQKLSIHMTHAHGYVSPRKAQRKKQEANRAKKKLNEEGKLTEEQREQVRAYLTKPEETTAVNLHEVLGMNTITAPMHQEIDEIRRDLGLEVTAGTLAHLMNDHAGTELPSPEDVKRLMEEGTMTKEEVQKLLHGSGESTGRDGVKFDNHFVDRLIDGTNDAISEDLPLEVLDSDEVFQLQDMSVEERAVAVDKIHQFNSINSTVSAADIYRETANKLQQATEAVKQSQTITLDLEQIMDMDIRSVARVLKAAGMSLKLSSVPKED